ncbi:MAG: hypothetical protein M3Z24_07810 [Chloroflexota bacterium]|nr:hypothetical protein [Chloroflexota bacterium]
MYQDTGPYQPSTGNVPQQQNTANMRDSLSQEPTRHLAPEPQHVVSKRPGGWRGRIGRGLLGLLLFLLGLGLGVGGTLLYALLIAANGQALITPAPSHGGDIVLQVDAGYIAHLVQEDMQSAGLPGTIKNVGVKLASGDQMTITGDDDLGLLGVKHFTLVIQPIISNCQVQIHVLHADLGGIPVTGFVGLFESQVNQQLQLKTDGLPKGFTYCMVAVRTDPKGLFITMSAKANDQSQSERKTTLAL